MRTHRLAALRELGGKTVSYVALAGEISAFKSREKLRIKRIDLDDWIERQAVHAR